MNWLGQAPIALIGLALVGGMIATHEVGLWIGKRARGLHARGQEPGFLVSATLALLGLLMAFTFSAAQERFRLREELLVGEANAISASYLLYQILDEPWRSDLSGLMRQYVQVRGRFDRAHTEADIDANTAETAALQVKIWREVRGAIQANPIPTMDPIYFQTTDQMFDTAGARQAAHETRLPFSVLWVLFFYALAATMLVGYVGAKETSSRLIVLGVSLLVALAFCLILDLDRPVAGSIHLNREPMERTMAEVLRGQR